MSSSNRIKIASIICQKKQPYVSIAFIMTNQWLDLSQWTKKFELIHRVGRYYPRIMQINMARFCISTFWHSCKCLNISNCSLQETCMSRNLNIKTRKDTLSKRISALENVRYQRLTQWQLQFCIIHYRLFQSGWTFEPGWLEIHSSE